MRYLFCNKPGNLEGIFNTSFLLTSAKSCQFYIQNISQMHPHFTIFITITLVKESRKPSPACAILKSLLITLSFFPSYDFHLFICLANKVTFQNVWNISDYVTQLLKTLVWLSIVLQVLSLAFKALLCLPQPELAAASYPYSPVISIIFMNLVLLACIPPFSSFTTYFSPVRLL